MSDEFLDDLNPPLPPRYRLRDVLWGEYSADDEHRFDVEYFTNERTFKGRLQLYFIKNQRSSLRIRIFNFFLKLLTFILYTTRVYLEAAHGPTQCYNFKNDTWSGCPSVVTNETDSENIGKEINWGLICWVNRDQSLWYIQVTVAAISLLQAALMMYLGYKGNVLQLIISTEFILELTCSLPFIITIFDTRLRNLFIPVFLNLWLAKNILENMFNDVQRVMNKSQSPLTQQLTVLVATIVSIFLISACGIQHLQRAGIKHLTLFDSIWFVVVSFSTVGYGDIAPDIWPSQLFMIAMICLGLTLLPAKLEKLAFTVVERNKKGGSYSRHRAETEKHVVVCATNLHTDAVMDFLNEFYAHPTLQGHYVVLLSPNDMEEQLHAILQIHIWAQRVIYIKGTALKDSDLHRCRMSHAFGCFILASRNEVDRKGADEHTVLRSWAIRDHSPHVKQYIQLFRPENKFHVTFATHVVCEDELKYALLAYNCLCPGTSSLVTLLLHTSRGIEGESAFDDWQKLYGRCSGNEIYEIKLSASTTFFKGYIGKSFSYATFTAHKKYGVCLIGVQRSGEHIQINPGPLFELDEQDTLFYMAITQEEHSTAYQKKETDERVPLMATDPELNREPIMKQGRQFVTMARGLGAATAGMSSENSKTDIGTVESQAGIVGAKVTVSRSSSSQLAPEGSNLRERRLSIAAVAEHVTELPEDDHTRYTAIELNPPDSVDSVFSSEKTVKFTENEPTDDSKKNKLALRVDTPPVVPYIGKGFHVCHLLAEPLPLCCLQLTPTDQCSDKHPRNHEWISTAIILASENCSKGLYNFILPLRNHRLRESEMKPIVLLLENEPDISFLEIIRHFPYVYWIQGSINNLHDWLRAGINYAENVVVVNMETSNSTEQDLMDCNTIVAVQTLFRLFPSAKIITELSQSSNMRFMQFRADDTYSLRLAKLEKEVKRKGSHISYMFRLPFSAGHIFSASMLDTLLYQAFVKEYLIEIVKLLLGINQGHNSGYLACLRVSDQDEKSIRTYGRLYQKLCSKSGAIPIGIYKTHTSTSSSEDIPENVSKSSELVDEKTEITQLVQNVMQSINIPSDAYEDVYTGTQREISYVIINPPHDLEIKAGYIVYVIKPATEAHTNQFKESRRRSQYRRKKPAEEHPNGQSMPRFELSVDEPEEITALLRET